MHAALRTIGVEQIARVASADTEALDHIMEVEVPELRRRAAPLQPKQPPRRATPAAPGAAGEDASAAAPSSAER